MGSVKEHDCRYECSLWGGGTYTHCCGLNLGSSISGKPQALTLISATGPGCAVRCWWREHRMTQTLTQVGVPVSCRRATPT